ncbi:peptidase E [Candidatus Saccharibacteria bacterium]|nr:peptidase E [Candidatus Saccharibacteria bacterium]
MKLFLASQDYGKFDERFVEMCGENRRVLLVSNAKDYKSAEERAESVERKLGILREMGMEAEELDLRNYFGKVGEMADFVKKWKPGAVVLAGGNTFILRKALAYSGMDAVINREVRAGRMVCAGDSAGAIVVGPSLAYFEAADDPNVVPDKYRREVIWEGMGLTDVRVVPHVGDGRFGELVGRIMEVFRQLGLEFVGLTDEEVLVVDGDKREVLR